MPSSNTFVLTDPRSDVHDYGFVIVPAGYWGPLDLHVDLASEHVVAAGEDILEAARRLNGQVVPEWAQLDAGHYHPRMYRGAYETRPSETGSFRRRLMRQSERLELQAAIEQEEIAADELLDICRVVLPNLKNRGVYGSRIRNLLLTVCTEVEAQWTGILVANNGGMPRKRLDTKSYVELRDPLRLDAYVVSCVRFEEYPAFQPFAGWDPAEPTRSLPWYDAYNKTKHDRARNFDRATLENAISALGALHVLLVAQYGPTYLDAQRRPFFQTSVVPRWRPVEKARPPHPADSYVAVPFFEREAIYSPL